MKKRVSLLLLAALLLTLCGCANPVTAVKEKFFPEPVTAASLLEDMSENLAEQGSVSLSAQGAFALSLDTGEKARQLKMDIDLTGEQIGKPLQLHVEGTAGTSVLGFDMDVPLEVYVLEEDGEVGFWVNVMDVWVTYSLDNALPATPATETGSGETEPSALLAAAQLSETTETIRDRACWRIDIPITGEMLSGATEGTEAEEAVDWSDMTAYATLWVDEETKLPARMSLKMDGTIVAEGIAIRQLDVLIDYSGFGEVESITLPNEALSAIDTGNLLDGLL